MYTIAFSDTLKRQSNLIYRWLWATMWLLGFELRTSRKAISVLNYWAISPPRYIVFLCDVFYLSVENRNNSQHYSTKWNHNIFPLWSDLHQNLLRTRTKRRIYQFLVPIKMFYSNRLGIFEGKQENKSIAKFYHIQKVYQR